MTDTLTKKRFSSSGCPEWITLRRTYDPRFTYRAALSSPEAVASFFRPLFAGEEVEVFLVACVDAKRNVRAVSEVSRGMLTGTVVHPREVFRVAVAFGAGGIFVAHNHPSGDASPSAEDRAITSELYRAGQVLHIPLIDHVIVTDTSHASFLSMGLL